MSPSSRLHMRLFKPGTWRPANGACPVAILPCLPDRKWRKWPPRPDSGIRARSKNRRSSNHPRPDAYRQLFVLSFPVILDLGIVVRYASLVGRVVEAVG